MGAEALYHMYATTLYGVIVKIVINEEAVEDLLQETFVRIWNAIEQYDAEKGRLFTWMVTIARHLDNADACNQTVINTDSIGVSSLLNLLTPEQKIIFHLIYYKSYKHIEVAESLNISLGTVKTRWRLGNLALRAVYGTGSDDTRLKKLAA
ncbi:RNA polymerase sigma factor [Mucilaginibacter corticis]|uniref:RNA polymerase sigma factor n=2 Tax=Mucilaginibacter corticis TaxID=2597670 RepID=A0A556M972_9SPHI|nr:RNA polymerase sigma factor [Mucilaginibacter corticis]